MKKLITLGFAAIAAGATFAAANDLLITFSTPGPDKYADGTTVLDGERYALCWSTDFSNFAIKADGTAEGGVVVLKAPVAKGGRCPTTVFEIDAGYAAANFPAGEWAVYMLDTRKFASDGTATLAATSTKVNTAGLVGTSVSVGSGTLASLTGATGAATDLPAGAEVAQPTITGIRIVEGKVFVTVKGAPYLAYGLVEGDTPSNVNTDVAGATSKASGEEEITIITDVKDGGAFFKVNRK
jgi:hypothetical protein